MYPWDCTDSKNYGIGILSVVADKTLRLLISNIQQAVMAYTSAFILSARISIDL
jgi:hypothetical protein